MPTLPNSIQKRPRTAPPHSSHSRASSVRRKSRHTVTARTRPVAVARAKAWIVCMSSLLGRWCSRATALARRTARALGGGDQRLESELLDRAAFEERAREAVGQGDDGLDLLQACAEDRRVRGALLLEPGEPFVQALEQRVPLAPLAGADDALDHPLEIDLGLVEQLARARL